MRKREGTQQKGAHAKETHVHYYYGCCFSLFQSLIPSFNSISRHDVIYHLIPLFLSSSRLWCLDLSSSHPATAALAVESDRETCENSQRLFLSSVQYQSRHAVSPEKKEEGRRSQIKHKRNKQRIDTDTSTVPLYGSVQHVNPFQEKSNHVCKERNN